MTREEFIKVLKEGGCSYEIEGDKLVVTHKGSVYLDSLENLPPGVEFGNDGVVSLDSLETIPPGVEFRNEGGVWLKSLKTLPPGVEFRNGGNVFLVSLVGGFFYEWKGNIEGVASKSLLNFMIKRELFI